MVRFRRNRRVRCPPRVLGLSDVLPTHRAVSRRRAFTIIDDFDRFAKRFPRTTKWKSRPVYVYVYAYIYMYDTRERCISRDSGKNQLVS